MSKGTRAILQAVEDQLQDYYANQRLCASGEKLMRAAGQSIRDFSAEVASKFAGIRVVDWYDDGGENSWPAEAHEPHEATTYVVGYPELEPLLAIINRVRRYRELS